jgi:hypothetical protein
MANDAPEFKKFAKECRDLARRVVNSGDREKLEEMAKAWEELAAQQDKK